MDNEEVSVPEINCFVNEIRLFVTNIIPRSPRMPKVTFGSERVCEEKWTGNSEVRKKLLLLVLLSTHCLWKDKWLGGSKRERKRRSWSIHCISPSPRLFFLSFPESSSQISSVTQIPFMFALLLCLSKILSFSDHFLSKSNKSSSGSLLTWNIRTDWDKDEDIW